MVIKPIEARVIAYMRKKEKVLLAKNQKAPFKGKYVLPSSKIDFGFTPQKKAEDIAKKFCCGFIFNNSLIGMLTEITEGTNSKHILSYILEVKVFWINKDYPNEAKWLSSKDNLNMHPAHKMILDAISSNQKGFSMYIEYKKIRNKYKIRNKSIDFYSKTKN